MNLQNKEIDMKDDTKKLLRDRALNYIEIEIDYLESVEEWLPISYHKDARTKMDTLASEARTAKFSLQEALARAEAEANGCH